MPYFGELREAISSRETEYKAKDFDTKEWITGFLFIDQNGANYIVDTNNDGDDGIKCRLRLVEHNTKRQFVYRNDVNGARIYEGDILHKDGYFDVVVMFIDSAFYVIPFGKMQMVPQYLKDYVTNTSRIIGNIFDDYVEASNE